MALTILLQSREARNRAAILAGLAVSAQIETLDRDVVSCTPMSPMVPTILLQSWLGALGQEELKPPDVDDLPQGILTSPMLLTFLLQSYQSQR